VADSAQEAEAARAVLDSQRASLNALGQPMPAAPEAAAPTTTSPTPRGRGPSAVAELLGAAPAAVISRLGPPRLRRPEADAEVWLYSAGGCQLDLMFYTTPQGLRVMHAQARAGGLGQRTEAACLRDIAAQGSRAAGAGI
jgi:hypothetical protein